MQEQQKTLKKNCKAEKIRLDQELQRIKERRAKIEADEQAALLAEIDQEYDAQNERLLTQKKANA